MMMFLLGVLVTWVVLSFLYVICDYYSQYNISDTIIGLPFYTIGHIFESIMEIYRVIKVLDLCYIYHISIISTSVATIKEKLDDKGKEKWVKRMPKYQQAEWRRVFGMAEKIE